MTTATERELLTVDEFAARFGITRTTIFAWLKTGQLVEGVHYIRIGRVLRFRWMLELFFSDKPKGKGRKRSASPGRSKAAAAKAINLDYGTTL